MSKVWELLSALRLRCLTLLRGVPNERHQQLVESLSALQSRLRATSRALANLERLIGSEIAKDVVEKIGFHMSSAVRRSIVEAVRRAYQAGAMAGVPSVVTIEVSSEELRWLDPDSIEWRVLDEWKHQSAPKLRAFVDVESPIALEEHVTILDVRVPQLGYREHIH
jgi:hypothetical protein